MTTPLRRRLEWGLFWFFIFCLIVGSAILLIDAVNKSL